MKLIALRLLLLAALTLCVAHATRADTITGEVISVTDGDTITVRDANQHRKIRLNGIDAPELDQKFGQEASIHLLDLLFGKQVVVIWSKTDRYDRIIGTVMTGSVDASLE